MSGEKSMRLEHDGLGELQIPDNSLFGIHTQRALTNFPLSNRRVNKELIHAYGSVKLAALETNFEINSIDAMKYEPLARACTELQNGLLDEHIVVDALQGGAGTSLNMNVNEVLANRALQILDRNLGDYKFIHPLDHVNLHQSTNDTFPTALKVAAIKLVRILEQEVVALNEVFQNKEHEFADVVKVGRTQLQDAVLTTLGKEMSAYADAFARDRWRIYKCEERLRVVNLGGTAIGTGLNAPKRYIFKATEKLKNITGIGLARSENLVDGTQNNDVFVEVSGILKACASNLFKVANDFRLLSSGPKAGLNELILPARQAGSSIMPGKINPVIPEAVMQGAMKVMSNDLLITNAVSQGNLELNSFLPLIADALLENLDLLINSVKIFRTNCVNGILPNREQCKKGIETSTATVTALVEKIGYDKASKIALVANEENITIKESAIKSGLIDENEFDLITSPEWVTKLGSK
jgi:aspartate ammonia-lyase